MPRLVAFLRAINVGGNTVPMSTLRALFEAERLQSVETFIASGNVIFTSRARNLAQLEQRIERRLHAALGFAATTFLRTEHEVAAIAKYTPFPAGRMRAAGALSVGFLAQPLGPTRMKTLLALKTSIDNFRVHGREIYWLCTKTQSQSKISNAVIERALGQRATFRAVRTIARLVDKYDFEPGVDRA